MTKVETIASVLIKIQELRRFLIFISTTEQMLKVLSK